MPSNQPGQRGLQECWGSAQRWLTSYLSGNYFRDSGAASFAGALAQCPALSHLDLSGNEIKIGGAESLAGVLALCASLAHLKLEHNQIGDAGTEGFAGVLAQFPALARLDLGYNDIGSAGAERLAGVLGQCPALGDLILSGNRRMFSSAGAGRLAAGLAALAHLNLSNNGIGDAGADIFAGVLAQCALLAHLCLWYNRLSAPAGSKGRESSRSSGAVHSAGSPRTRLQSHWISRGRESCTSVAAVRSAGSPRSL
jgi:Ran GTPase-activating protein (RanGAP) involved in mRNA processing and transport